MTNRKAFVADDLDRLFAVSDQYLCLLEMLTECVLIPRVRHIGNGDKSVTSF